MMYLTIIYLIGFILAYLCLKYLNLYQDGKITWSNSEEYTVREMFRNLFWGLFSWFVVGMILLIVLIVKFNKIQTNYITKFLNKKAPF